MTPHTGRYYGSARHGYRGYRGYRGYGHYDHYDDHYDHHDDDFSLSLGFGFHNTYVDPYPAPVIVDSAPVIESYPAVPAQPVVPQPAVPGAAPAPAGNVIFEGVVSRDDDIAYKEIPTVDGIIVKVKDTDDDPLDADIEVRVDHYEEEFEDVPIGASIPVVGLSGQTFYLNVFDIHDDSETVSFAIVQ